MEKRENEALQDRAAGGAPAQRCSRVSWWQQGVLVAAGHTRPPREAWLGQFSEGSFPLALMYNFLL